MAVDSVPTENSIKMRIRVSFQTYLKLEISTDILIFSRISSYIPWHSPSTQRAAWGHASLFPHLQDPAVQVSVFPEHLSFAPQWQMPDIQISESPAQSSLP